MNKVTWYASIIGMALSGSLCAMEPKKCVDSAKHQANLAAFENFKKERRLQPVPSPVEKLQHAIVTNDARLCRQLFVQYPGLKNDAYALAAAHNSNLAAELVRFSAVPFSGKINKSATQIAS